MHNSAAVQADAWDWERLRGRAVTLTGRLVGPDDAEDAAQEALVRAWRFRARCHTPEAPLGWVMTIARREAFRLESAPRPAPVAEAGEDLGGSGGFRGAQEIDAGDAVGELAAADRLLVLLRYREDLTTREIARIVDWPEATVRVRLHRLRRRLSEKLGDQ